MLRLAHRSGSRRAVLVGLHVAGLARPCGRDRNELVMQSCCASAEESESGVSDDAHDALFRGNDRCHARQVGGTEALREESVEDSLHERVREMELLGILGESRERM